jgi:pre-mRNA-splicing helicase BRR2
LLEILCAASEYDDLPIRHKEDSLLEKLHSRIPVKIEKDKFHDPHNKALILLQCHFSRTQLPPDLEADQKVVLSKAVNLVYALVDVISSNGWFTPAVAAMELSQMIVQALWNHDSALKQLPHFTDALIKKCTSKKVENIFDVMELEDEDRDSLLGMNEKQMADVARFCNRYPSIDLSYEIKNPDSLVAGEPIEISIKLERELDESLSETGPVIAPFYPQKKDEGWWIVIGNQADNSLLAIKRLTLQRSSTVETDFTVNKSGQHKLKLFFICDSYMGCDQDHDLVISVAKGDNDEEEAEEEEHENKRRKENEDESEEEEEKEDDRKKQPKGKGKGKQDESDDSDDGEMEVDQQ